MKRTLEMLENAALELQRRKLKEEPALQKLAEEEDALYRAFREKHRHNHALIRQVNDLIDANCALEDACSRLQFYMGLQMGVELAALDVLEMD